MRLPDRATGLFLVGLGSLAAYGGWLLPPVPGQPVGPNVFPIVIGVGAAGATGAALAFGSAEAAGAAGAVGAVAPLNPTTRFSI